MLHQEYKLLFWQKPPTEPGFYEIVSIGHYALPWLWTANLAYQAMHHSHYSIMYKSEQKCYYTHVESFLRKN